jgi:hypothetical protein
LHRVFTSRRTVWLKENAMATSPDLPPPVTPHPPDVPELPVEPDEGPATPPGDLALPKTASAGKAG